MATSTGSVDACPYFGAAALRSYGGSFVDRVRSRCLSTVWRDPRLLELTGDPPHRPPFDFVQPSDELNVGHLAHSLSSVARGCSQPPTGPTGIGMPGGPPSYSITPSRLDPALLDHSLQSGPSCLALIACMLLAEGKGALPTAARSAGLHFVKREAGSNWWARQGSKLRPLT